MQNLNIAFPEKSLNEKKQIARKFYRNFTDTFIETLKMLTASKAFINRHFKGNWEVINSLQKTGKSVQVHLGHNFNWEWCNLAAAVNISYKFYVVYMPIGSSIVDRLFKQIRAKFGTHLIAASSMKKDFINLKNQQYLLALVADQNPSNPENAWWIDFFGKPAPFVKGPEKAAITNDLIVVFAFIHKPKRGYYEIVFENPIYANKEMRGGEMTLQYAHYLENVIRQNPDMWLWSHRRWKHDYKESYNSNRL